MPETDSKDFMVNAAPQTVHSAINQYLQAEGYEYINFDGENVFKKGRGFFNSPTFFKFSYAGNVVRLETWMKYAFMPGVYVGEIGVDGFAGDSVKGAWKKRLKNIERMLSDFSVQPSSYATASVRNDSVVANDNETQLLKENAEKEETRVLTQSGTAYGATKTQAFCSGCGARIPDGSRFCAVCGKQCADTKRAEPVQQPRQAAPRFEPQPGSFAANETPRPPEGASVSRKEFIEKYAQPSLRRNITSIAILCYVCAGINFVASCFLNPFGIIDSLVLAGLTFGMHLAKNRICAILILALSIVEAVIAIAFLGITSVLVDYRRSCICGDIQQY